MIKTSHALVALALVLVPSLANPQDRLARPTLDEAIAMATRENPTLRAKTREVQATRANEITAALRPNPSASYSADQLAGRTAEPQHIITLGQLIETGGKRLRRIESAQAATRVTAHELADVRRQVVFQVQKAFTDVLVAEATRALAAENLKTLDEVERIQRVRAEKGDISQLELVRLQIQRFAFERDAGDARQAIDAAKIALRAAVGPDAVAEAFDVVGELGFRELTLDREALRGLAIQNRPDLRAVEATREKARADVNLARANAWWDVTPQVAYQRIGSDNTIGFGFSIPLRIFDRNQGEIARTRAEVERADALRQAAAVQALTEVDTALSAVLVQRERVVALRDSYLPKARQARQTVEFAYRRGGASLLDFLDAQRTYRETALEHLRALGNFWSALYPLETVGGGARGRTSMSVQCAVLLLLALLSAACGDSSVPPLALPKPEAGTAAGPTDLTPKVVAPEYRTRLSVIETTGKVQFNGEALVRVQAPATGRVLEGFAQPGDILEPGARLFVIDSADLGAAKSDYAKAVADAERSAAALKLTRELFEVQAG